jgi:hypothetical protein
MSRQQKKRKDLVIAKTTVKFMFIPVRQHKDRTDVRLIAHKVGTMLAWKKSS